MVAFAKSRARFTPPGGLNSFTKYPCVEESEAVSSGWSGLPERFIKILRPEWRPAPDAPIQIRGSNRPFGRRPDFLVIVFLKRFQRFDRFVGPIGRQRVDSLISAIGLWIGCNGAQPGSEGIGGVLLRCTRARSPCLWAVWR